MQQFPQNPSGTIRNPMSYTLGTAAKATGLAKSTIHRAIKRGLISARSKDSGGYEIDPAELHRVYPPVAQEVPSNGSENSAGERSATPELNRSNTVEPLEVRLAKAEAQIEGLKEILEIERKRAEELRQERDKWSGMAEASQRQIVDLSKRPKGFMSWLRRA